MCKILTLNQVTKYYDSKSVVTRALNGVSFCVQKGEFVAIMGASGSGKSTLLNVISTIDRATSGEILIDGVQLSAMVPRQLAAFRRDKLGFVFQQYNLLNTLTAGENRSLPLHLQGLNSLKTHQRLTQVAQTLNIGDLLNRFPWELSGGQQQRITCARAIVTNPSLVLADEPTGALDSQNSQGLMRTFDMLNRSLGSTILMVTHDPSVGAYASRVLFLKDGQIYSEIYRGQRTHQQLQADILSVVSAMGG